MIKIDKKMSMGEMVQKWPNVAKILAEKYQMHCASCPMARMETLEEGARGHGMTKKEIEAMVEDLNKLKGEK